MAEIEEHPHSKLLLWWSAGNQLLCKSLRWSLALGDSAVVILHVVPGFFRFLVMTGLGLLSSPLLQWPLRPFQKGSLWGQLSSVCDSNVRSSFIYNWSLLLVVKKTNIWPFMHQELRRHRVPVSVKKLLNNLSLLKETCVLFASRQLLNRLLSLDVRKTVSGSSLYPFPLGRLYLISCIWVLMINRW